MNCGNRNVGELALDRDPDPGPGPDRDRGSATAELASGLPALFVVVLFAVGLIWTVSLQARCGDAARIGARLAARGETEAAVVRAVTAAAAPNAQVSVTHADEFVRVAVTCSATGNAAWRLTDVHAAAVAVAESGVAAPAG